MSAAQHSYEKWIWVELVGFDNGKCDFGVDNYIDALGFKPNAICLFVSSPDFILLHPDIGKNGVLPIDCCMYAAHSFNEERKRQDWTQERVRGLINELHRHGVGVYVSTMTWFTHNRFHEEWLNTHQEMIAWENVGPEPSNNMNPLKRLKDGAYFEDFFLKQLLDVIHYYGFDGWHAADGWGPAMNNIYDADFSDDMVDQFTQARDITLPPQYAGANQEDRAFLKARADWIWRHKRIDWIEFYVERWHSFYKIIADALHREQKSVIVNSALTRDPFEAIYRFGIDYKKLAEAGVDGIVVETGAAAQDLVSGDRNRHYDYTATLMLMKAYVPETKLIFLHVIRDHCENFDGLHHMPTAIEKEVLSLSNIYCYDSAENLKNCADGLMACLGDSILPEEWKWLHGIWKIGFSGDTKSVDGPTLVWSDNALRNQLDDFITTRRWHTQKLLFNLMERGAPVQAVANVNNLHNVNGPILLINPNTFSDEEIELIFSLKNRPIIVVGAKSDALPRPDFQFEDTAHTYPLSCCVYGANDLPDVTISDNTEDKLPSDVMDIVEAHFFTIELDVRSVSDEFLNACAAVISSAASSVRITDGAGYVKAMMAEQRNGTHRLILKSDSYHYCKATIELGRKIESAKTITSFPYAPIDFQGSELRNVTIPNKGAVIVDVKFAE
ncbi:MAG: hypothetical protein ACYC64_08150 [Armatimonadota bacterium]